MSQKSWLQLIVLSFIWGSSYFFIELALTSFLPITLVFIRLVIAACALVLLISFTGEKLPRDLKTWLAFAFMGLTNNVVPFCFISYGQVYINGSIACILTATTPIFAVVLAHIFTHDEKMTIPKILGVILGFMGVMVMMLPSLDQGLSLIGIGQLAVLVAAFSYALSSVFGRKFMRMGPNVSSTGMLICSSFMMLPVVLAFEKPVLAFSFDLVSIFAVLALALLSSLLAYQLYFRILATEGATNLMLVTFLMPISAMALGISILGETVELSAILGMAIILMGLVMIDGRFVNYIMKRRK